MAAKQQGKTAKPAPISRHPAFPAIVALWFAALLGLGSLVLPVALIEALVRATGIATIVPAAEPPLGVTARIAIAAAAAALGALCGIVIARRVANAHGANAPSRMPAAGKHAMRPISASEELGSESLDAGFEAPTAPAFIGRRRALAVTDESGRSPWLDAVDLPGEAPITVDAAPECESAEALELELDQVAEPSPEASEAALQPPYEAPCAFHDPAGPAFAVPELDATPYASEPPAPAVYDEEPEAMTDTFVPHPFAESHADPECEPAFEADDQPVERDNEAVEGALEERALDTLSMAELVERFALSLRTAAERRDEAAALAAFPEEPESEPEPENDVADEPARYVPDLGVAAEPAPRFATESEHGLPPVPHALQAVESAEEAEEEEDVLASLTLPLSSAARPFAQPGTAFAGTWEASEGDNADEDDEDDGFSSLLDLRSKLGAERDTVRVEDPEPESAFGDTIEPAVVFPGHDQRRTFPAPEGGVSELERPFAHEPARPFDAPGGKAATPSVPVDESQTERALRDALHKLQRMSGAI